MAESGFTLGYVDFRKAVGRYLGLGSDDSEWNADESDDIDGIIKSAQRQIYWPEFPDGHSLKDYKWSWMRPTYTFYLTDDGLVDGEPIDAVDLPDDFGSVYGEDATFVDDTTGTGVLHKVGEGVVRRAQEDSSGSGRPSVFAVRVKSVTLEAEKSSRWELLVDCTPDAVYQIELPYNRLPEPVSADTPYPLGGAQMSEVFLEGCLAVAEQRSDDSESSNHQSRFMSLLSTAIRRDAANAAPTRYGSLDAHTGSESRLHRLRESNLVTYGDVLYD